MVAIHCIKTKILLTSSNIDPTFAVTSKTGIVVEPIILTKLCSN